MTAYDVQIQLLESIPLAVIRRHASPSELSRLVPECCGLVWNVVGAQKVKAGRHVAIYWDARLEIEIGVELYEPFEEEGEVVRSRTPAGAAVIATHFGRYSGLGLAHKAVREWCQANQHSLAGPNWEIYGHWQSEWNSNPSLIRTDVCYQLAD